jgi:hypothetical protein
MATLRYLSRIAGPFSRTTSASGPRSFDPRRLGGLEARAWVAYYRRDWLTLLRAALVGSYAALLSAVHRA